MLGSEKNHETEYRMFDEINHVYCVLYTISVCKKNNRVEMVRSSSILQSEVAQALKNRLWKYLFESVRRVFEGPNFEVKHPFRTHSLGIDAKKAKVGSLKKSF